MNSGRRTREDACETSMETCEGKVGENLRSLASRGCGAVRPDTALHAVVVADRTRGKKRPDEVVVTVLGQFMR